MPAAAAAGEPPLREASARIARHADEFARETPGEFLRLRNGKVGLVRARQASRWDSFRELEAATAEAERACLPALSELARDVEAAREAKSPEALARALRSSLRTTLPILGLGPLADRRAFASRLCGAVAMSRHGAHALEEEAARLASRPG